MIEVPRTAAPVYERPALSWHPARSRDHVIPMFTCPDHSTGPLDEDWTVAGNGTVSPSVDCRCGCGFHDYIRLLDWEPDWLPSRGPKERV